MYSLTGKASCKKEELCASKKIGLNKVELYLNKAMTEDDFKSVIETPGIDVVNIHTPLDIDETRTSIDITNLGDPICKNIFESTCYYAQELAEHYKHEVNVILHNSMSENDFNLNLIYRIYLRDLFEILIAKYPSVNFCIENVAPVASNGDYRNGRKIKDTFAIIDYFNNDLGKKFYLTFDLCHFFMSIRSHLMMEWNIFDVNDYSQIYQEGEFCLENVFKMYGDAIRVIHLSIPRKDGCGKNHGLGFTDDSKDISILKNFFNLYNRYNCTAEIVLEIKEDDYTNMRNKEKTIELIRKHCE